MWKDPDVTVTEAKSPFILACRREPVPYTPVWFMRQAGRSLPEYRRVGGGVFVVHLCTPPPPIFQITLQPPRPGDGGAGLLFCGILGPPRAVRLDVGIKGRGGPVG